MRKACIDNGRLTPAGELTAFVGGIWIAGRAPSNLFYALEWSASTGMNYRYKKDYPIPGIKGMMDLNLKFKKVETEIFMK